MTLNEKIKSLIMCDNTDVYENITDTMISETDLNDDWCSKRGLKFLSAAFDNNADAMCIAFTGWSIDSILKRSVVINDDDCTFNTKPIKAKLGTFSEFAN